MPMTESEAQRLSKVMQTLWILHYLVENLPQNDGPWRVTTGCHQYVVELLKLHARWKVSNYSRKQKERTYLHQKKKLGVSVK